MTIPGREDLRTYAAIGDGRTVALIVAVLSIVWHWPTVPVSVTS